MPQRRDTALEEPPTDDVALNGRRPLGKPGGRRPRGSPAAAGRVASSLSAARRVEVETALHGEASELDAVVHLELAEDVLHVVLHRAVREEQGRGDLLVAHARRDV